MGSEGFATNKHVCWHVIRLRLRVASASGQISSLKREMFHIFTDLGDG